MMYSFTQLMSIRRILSILYVDKHLLNEKSSLIQIVFIHFRVFLAQYDFNKDLVVYVCI